MIHHRKLEKKQWHLGMCERKKKLYVVLWFDFIEQQKRGSEKKTQNAIVLHSIRETILCDKLLNF